jgi:DNA-binding MarR family transcriptional regulator
VTRATREQHAADAATLDRLERGLVALLAWLNDRATIGDLARRSGHTLPPASWALLEHLDRRGSMRVSEIAACHGVHTSSVTPRLQGLEEQGLIERGSDPADGRVSIITLTPTGCAALQSIHTARQQALASALEGIGADELERAAEVVGAIAERVAVDQRPT